MGCSTIGKGHHMVKLLEATVSSESAGMRHKKIHSANWLSGYFVMKSLGFSLWQYVACSRACRIGSDVANRVGTTRRACWLSLQVVRGQVCPSYRCAGCQSVLHGVLLLTGVNLLQVCYTRSCSARFSSADEVRNSNCQQNTNDQNHDHDFNQSKSLFNSFHLNFKSPNN